MSGFIKKKQVLGLLEDLTALQHSLPILRRNTSFSGIPDAEQAVLDSETAAEVTQLLINVKDNTIGNSYSQLNEISVNDKLIIKNQNTGDLTVYLITNITSEVNSSHEGYFILTVQHSFGYDNSLQSGELIYYFRRVTSSSIFNSIAEEEARATSAESSINDLITSLSLSIENVIELIYDEKARTFAAENRLEGQMLALIQSVGSVNKYVEEAFIEDEITITHNLGTPNVIVQVINDMGINYNINVTNYDTNTVKITRQDSNPGDTYNVIIIG